MNGFKPIKAFKVERHDRRDRSRTGREQLDLLAVAE